MVLLLAAATVVIPATRTHLLRAAGEALVAEDPLEPSDIIVVTADSDGAGLLEAADLVHSGIAARVAVFEDPPDSIDREFLRRGVPYEDARARWLRQLTSLGVQSVEVVPRPVSGTEDEGRVLPPWFDEQHFKAVVVVTTADHSRRVGRVLRRAMQGHPTRVRVRYARYSQFDPAEWWQSRGAVRTGIVELEKLFLDLIRHPFS